MRTRPLRRKGCRRLIDICEPGEPLAFRVPRSGREYCGALFHSIPEVAHRHTQAPNAERAVRPLLAISRLVCEVRLLVTSRQAIGFDVGATRIKAVVVDSQGAILEKAMRGTDAAGWRNQIATLCGELTSRYGTDLEIGVCSPGLVGKSGDHIWDCAGKMTGLDGLNWQSHLQWSRAVPALNDAHAALLGETWLGAAAGRRHVVLLTLGTGIGGAALIDGVLLRGALGRAGHMGHISINPGDEHLSILNTPGSLEHACGNLTIKKRSDGTFEDTKHLLEAVDRQEVLALEVWNRSMNDLARGVVSIINVLDPEIVLLGGGIASYGEKLLEALRPKLAKWEWRPQGVQVELKLASLGAWAGAIGAARQAMLLKIGS